jgi:UDP-N-acetylmuramate: L-alanyl-gamma-D-glutamyl-meso-diaminopimelate ligase
VIGRDDAFTTLELLLDNEPCRMRTTLFGDFNFDNITMAATMAFRLGVAPRDIAAAVETFRGVRRPQEFRRDEAKLKVIEDFAHHPTAIDGMLRAARERFAGFRLVALYEPRSATGRRNTFQHELPGALALADEVLIKQLYRPETIAADQRLDVDAVVRDIAARGVPLQPMAQLTIWQNGRWRLPGRSRR